MENHHVQWVNPLFQWQFSIAMLVYQRVYYQRVYQEIVSGMFHSLYKAILLCRFCRQTEASEKAPDWEILKGWIQRWILTNHFSSFATHVCFSIVSSAAVVPCCTVFAWIQIYPDPSGCRGIGAGKGQRKPTSCDVRVLAKLGEA